MIIAAYAGVGKTTYAKLHAEDTLDFVCMPYKYEQSDEADKGEAGKACSENTMDPEWPFNYVDALEKIKDGHKFILIPSDTAVLYLLKERGMPFLLVTPLRSAKEEYRRRFIERGNSNEFIEIFIEHWDSFMDSLERVCPCVRIALDIDEYLTDFMDNIENQALSLGCTSLMMLQTCGAIEIIEGDAESRIEIKSDLYEKCMA
jgi:hypothetical protein